MAAKLVATRTVHLGSLSSVELIRLGETFAGMCAGEFWIREVEVRRTGAN